MNSHISTFTEWKATPIDLRSRLAATEAALWEIIELMDKHSYYGFRPEVILEKHGVPIPKGKEV